MKSLPEERAALLKEFNAADPETLFPQQYLAAYRNCSIETIERDRWAGTGCPYLKIGRAVRYKKSTVLAWAHSRGEVISTSAIQKSEKA